MSVSIGEETGGSELPSSSRHATSPDTWPKGEHVTYLATYVILWTFGEGWGGDNDEDYTGTKLRFERWTKPSDLDAKPQYVCYFTSGACNGLFECDVYDYETKFTDFKPLAYDKNMSECRAHLARLGRARLRIQLLMEKMKGY